MNKKILLVDDDIDIISTIKPVLQSEGYEVITSDNKNNAFELAMTHKPSIAILDVMMNTQYEGFELAKALKTTKETQDIKVIMHTSIDVFTTTNPSIQAMAREIRKDPNNRDMRVVLIKNIVSGDAGIDYMNDAKENVFLSVDAFLPKPVEFKKIREMISKLS